MCKSDPKPIRIRSDRIFSDFGSSKIISDRIGLEPDFQLLELEKESSSVKVNAPGLVFWSCYNHSTYTDIAEQADIRLLSRL